MRRIFTLTTLALFCSAAISANYAMADNGGKGKPSGQKTSTSQNRQPANANNQSNQTAKSIIAKVVTGTKNGVGFIADPAPRSIKTTPSSNVTKITDPVPTKTLGTTATLNQSSLTSIPGNPPRATPVVRDHTLPNPNYTPPGGSYDSITSENGFSFELGGFEQTSAHRKGIQVVDHREGHPYVGGEFTPSTSGPANNGTINPGRTGGK